MDDMLRRYSRVAAVHDMSLAKMLIIFRRWSRDDDARYYDARRALPACC